MTKANKVTRAAKANKATERREKLIRLSAKTRFSQGWTPEQVAARIWLCYGHLTSFTADSVTVQMNAGNETFRAEVQ